MRIKLLLLFILVSCGLAKAQEVVYYTDTIKTIVFSEMRVNTIRHAYVELTNVGTTPVNLSSFAFGAIAPWSAATPNYNGPNSGGEYTLPNVVLEPGKSLVFAAVRDWDRKMMAINPEKYNAETQKDMWWRANYQIHVRENDAFIDPNDSISTNGVESLGGWEGRLFYIKQYFSRTDNQFVIIDAIHNELVDGGPPANRVTGAYDDVAGVTQAVGRCVLVRKFSVKQGSTDWAKARGIDLTDSEWMPIPFLSGEYEPNRRPFFTIGNHGDYKLDAQSFSSPKLIIDFSAKTIQVPWGVRNDDSIISACNLGPGLAWHYTYSPSSEDSSYASVRTGDILTMYACGNTLQQIDFNLTLKAPTNDDNIVMPRRARAGAGFYTPYLVSDGIPGMDTISNVAFATRKDSLLKYLEKPEIATWEVLYVDGKERIDLKNGDKLKVTSKSGKAKEYFIKVEKILPNHYAELSAITWPDIPDYMKGLLGWKGDTIPNFDLGKNDYVVSIPPDMENVPALVAKPRNVNAKVTIERAVSLNGKPEQRTTTFYVTAQDDTTHRTYTVQFNKLKDEDKIQPNIAEPFISEVVFRSSYDFCYFEIFNPGTEPLDLSRYMMVNLDSWRGGGTPAAGVSVVLNPTEADWKQRYTFRYIPGKVWSNLDTWLVTPGLVVDNSSVNPIVQPGDVFVMGGKTNNDTPYNYSQCDVRFDNQPNQFGDTFGGDGTNIMRYWTNFNTYLMKIINDSVYNGLKPIGDINDFEVIDAWGSGGGWVIGGVNRDGGQQIHYVRKPTITQGNPELGLSFGTTLDDCEWIARDAAYYGNNGYGWGTSPNHWQMLNSNVGTHSMYPTTDYISTIKTIYYKASDGYSMDETIKSLKTGTTVADFLAKILKENEGQTLEVIGKTSGTKLAETASISDGDALVVTSANGRNTTKYTITVTTAGLSSDAKLTSTKYTVAVSGATGTVSGIAPIGVSLEALLNDINVPAGATLTVLDKAGFPVPLKTVNFDSTYVLVMVNNLLTLEVIAEDFTTKIVYTLKTTATNSDAFITSDLYTVDQTASLVTLVPRGTTVPAFIKNVVPAPGASVRIEDKGKFLREDGTIYQDDKVIVTSQDGSKTKTYLFSMLNDSTNKYLAFVYSTVYAVDQYTMAIKGGSTNIIGSSLVSAVKANLTSSFGASFQILDKDGNVKTTGDMNVGDKLQVTSADGMYTNTYNINVDVTSVSDLGNGSLRMYPNPTSGILNIAGAQAGQQVEIFNAVGAKVQSAVINSSKQTLSLHGQPSGVYMVIVKENNRIINSFKISKQ